jgi:hypothetical protein
MDTSPLASHRFSPGIECVSKDRPLRFNKVFTLIHDFFKRLPRPTREITEIILRATRVPPKLVSRFITRLWRQQQRGDRAYCRPTQECQ